MRNKFNMLLWLCVYKEFYCKKVSMTCCIKLSSMMVPVCCIQIRRKPAFVQVLQENLTQYMEPEYLQLILIFAGFDHSVKPNSTRTEPKSIQELYQPQWRGYLKVHYYT